jgi:hypothetical protein
LNTRQGQRGRELLLGAARIQRIGIMPRKSRSPKSRKQQECLTKKHKGSGKSSDADDSLSRIKDMEQQGDVVNFIKGLLMHSPEMQGQACAALQTLAVNDDNQVKIGGAGGIEGVVAAMVVHPKHQGVQQRVCVVLWSLLQQGSLIDNIQTAGGVERVRHAIAAEDATERTKEVGKKFLAKLTGSIRERETAR